MPVDAIRGVDRCLIVDRELREVAGRLKKAGKTSVLPTFDSLEIRLVRGTFRSAVIAGERIRIVVTEAQDYRGQTVCWLPVRERGGYPDHRAWP